MTASNHFIAGATIGAAIGNPWIAVPLAVASHFVLDAGPQYGYDDEREDKRLGLSLFQWVLALDIMMFAILIWMLTFVIDRPELVFFGLAGYSPDLMWIHRFFVTEKVAKNLRPKMNRLQKFHAGIQKFESPKFLPLEVGFFIILAYTLIILSA